MFDSCGAFLGSWQRHEGVVFLHVWEAIDNKLELDLRGSSLASFDEMGELLMLEKLKLTAELSVRNELGGALGRRQSKSMTISCEENPDLETTALQSHHSRMKGRGLA